MSNKKLTPEMWFKKEQQLKREFLEYLFNTGKLHIDGQQNLTLPKINNFPTPPTSELANILSGYIIILEDFFGFPKAKLQPDEYQFEKLKNDYRSYKFDLKNINEKRVKLQVYINQKTYDMLEKLRSEFEYESLDNCLKTLIDGNSTDIKKIKEKNDQLRKELEEQRQLTVQIRQHQNELIENNNILRIRAEHFAKALNTYLGTELFEKLSYHLQYVLPNFISTDQYKNSEFESLSQLIIEELKPKILYDLKMNKFINDEQ